MKKEMNAKQLAQLQKTLNTDIRSISGAVKTHKYGKFDYVPIDMLKSLFRATYGFFREEVVSQQITGEHTITTHLRVHYYNPFINEISFFDGVGTASMQGKQDSAMIAPKAKSEAFKNAVTDAAPLFGRNLRRKDEMTSNAIETMVKRINESIWNQ